MAVGHSARIYEGLLPQEASLPRGNGRGGLSYFGAVKSRGPFTLSAVFAFLLPLSLSLSFYRKHQLINFSMPRISQPTKRK